MDDNEINKWDDALLDLINKGLIEVVKKDDGTTGFRLYINNPSP